LAAKKYFVNLSLNKNQILDLSLENRSSYPDSPSLGQIYFHTVEKKIKIFDGSVWQSISESKAIEAADYLIYKGSLNHLDNSPLSPRTGDLYIFSSPGIAINFGNQKVENGDFVIYNGTTWDIIQKNLNIENATQEVSGIISLASQIETNEGMIANKAITPVTLDGYKIANTLSSVLLFENQTITAAGKFINHNLNNKNISVNFYLENEKVILNYLTPTPNTIEIKTTYDLIGVNVVIIGHNL
jgi:hypothetical protein